MYDKKANSTLSGLPQGQTSIFRVQPHKDKPTEPVYHSRRAHQKSRSGCWTCKRRRVKCDETKPHCKRCQKYGIECDYAALQRYPRQTRGLITEFLERLPYLTALDSNGYSMALQAAAEKIDELLQVKPSKDRARYDGLMALHYFHSRTLTNPGQNVPPVVKAKLMDLGIQSPFVMHAMIASTTTHLCHIVPDNSSYKAIAAYHWREAVSQYSNALSTNVGPENMDALISGCLLLTMNSFMLEEFNPRSSFVFSTNPESLNWLMLQSGLRHLLYLTRPWFPQSIWFESFMASRGDEDSHEDQRPGRVGMDPEMADLCGIDESTVEETNPYWWPLRMLAHIVPLERSIKSFSRYTNFMGRLMPEYYQKLLQKDPPALVILAWWLALMSYMPVWWINTRVKSECVAICMFLENSPDPRVLRLLEFPAETCGYLLRHVRERDVLGSCMDVVQEV